MRVLVFEQSHAGHHYQYVRHLLAGLVQLPVDVVVALTRHGYHSAEFKTFLLPFEDQVEFDASVPGVSPRLRDRWAMYKNLMAAVQRHRPDFLYVPSADWQTDLMGAMGLLGRSALPESVHGEAAFHYGSIGSNRTIKHQVKEFARIVLQRHSGWRKIFFVNFQHYERAVRSAPSLATRIALLPDPIRKYRGPGKLEARKLLGIPEDGRYVGVSGVLDERKGIPELLHAWARAGMGERDRMLFAGRLSPDMRRLMNREGGDELVRRSTLIAMDRFLGEAEFHAALAAVDVVWAVYPNFNHLSSIVLNATAAGRPIISLDYGWCGEMVRRFQLGWVCSSVDRDVLTRTLAHAMEQAGDYKVSESAERLLRFHDPENFAETWMMSLRATIHKTLDRPIPTWGWVNGQGTP